MVISLYAVIKLEESNIFKQQLIKFLMKTFIKYCLISMLFFNLNTYSQEENRIAHIVYKGTQLGKITGTDSLQRYEGFYGPESLLDIDLFFDRTKSISSLRKKLEIDGDQEFRGRSIAFRGIYYKDIETKEKFKQASAFNELLNITYPLIKWNITKETKMIGKYLCYKATFEKIEPSRTKEEGLLFITTAWFTLDIPVPFGPLGIDGLPGLVLEANRNQMQILSASIIDLNSTAKPIVRPKKGKNVSEEGFLQIYDEFFMGLPLKGKRKNLSKKYSKKN